MKEPFVCFLLECCIKPGLPRVIGLTWPENAPSQRVLEKIGMRFEGEAIHYGHTMRVYAATRAPLQ